MAYKYRKEVFRYWWGLLMVSSGIVMATEAVIAWINIDTFFTSPAIPFTFRLILEWFVIALQVSMLCVFALKKHLTEHQRVFYPVTLLICIIVAVCYDYFNGHYTTLYSWKDIFINIAAKDVQVKLFIFLLSIICTGYLLYYPFYSGVVKKNIKFTGWFWFYIIIAHLQPITYILYALGSPVSGIILSFGCLIFITAFSIALQKNENPMVLQLKDYSKEQNKVVKSLDFLDESIKKNKYFLIKDITPEQLAQKTGIFTHKIIDEYQKKGFATFSDYMNAFRYIQFKELQQQYPNVPKEILITDSGFSSIEQYQNYIK